MLELHYTENPYSEEFGGGEDLKFWETDFYQKILIMFPEEILNVFEDCLSKILRVNPQYVSQNFSKWFEGKKWGSSKYLEDLPLLRTNIEKNLQNI